MSCAHFLSVCLLLALLGIYLRDNRLKQTDQQVYIRDAQTMFSDLIVFLFS